jgi:hypothetical protein
VTRRTRLLTAVAACGALSLAAWPAAAAESFDDVTHDATEGATSVIANDGVFSMTAAVDDPAPISVDDLPMMAMSNATVSKSFIVAPGEHTAKVALRDLFGKATRTRFGGASASLSAALHCETCTVLNTASVTLITAVVPTWDTVDYGAASVLLRFTNDSTANATVKIVGHLDAGASSGGFLFGDGFHASWHGGQSSVNLRGVVEPITVTAAPPPE